MHIDKGQDSDRGSQLGPTKCRRGFAVMSVKDRRRIAAMGGRAAHEQGAAHQFTKKTAQEAGRRGGLAVSGDREHMARIGRRGGEQRRANMQAQNAAPELPLVLPLLSLGASR